VSVVQTLPSSQLIGVWTQPVAGSHVSVVQALPSSQFLSSHLQPPGSSQRQLALQAFGAGQVTGV
jgi:hypothetical protein